MESRFISRSIAIRKTVSGDTECPEVSPIHIGYSFQGVGIWDTALIPVTRHLHTKQCDTLAKVVLDL